MLSKPLIAFSNAYGFEIENEYAYGEIEGYMVSVFNSGTKKSAYISCYFGSTDANESFDSFALSNDIAILISEKGLTALNDYELNESGISFTTNEELMSFDKAVTELIGLLKSRFIPCADFCAHCGADSKVIVIDKMRASYLCDECASEYFSAEGVKSKPIKKTLKGSVFAALGALCVSCAILAVIIWCIPSNGFANLHPLIITLPLVCVLTVVSFLAYRLSTKRKGTERILPCLLISSLFTSVSVYLSTAVIYAKDLGVASFSRAFKAFKPIFLSPINDPTYRFDFLTHIFYSLIVVIITVLIYSIVFEEKTESELKLIPLSTSRYYSDEGESNL